MNEVAAPAVRPSAPPRALPEFHISLTLKTEFALRVHHKSFDRLKGDLYVLTVRTLAGGMDEAATAIETILTETFAGVRKDLDAELERSDALLDAAKLNELAAYKAAVIEETYSTPRAKEFLDLLLKMDQLLMRYDALWLTGHIETRQRWNRCMNWQRRMTKVANRLRDLGNRTRSGLTREAERRAASASTALAGDPKPPETAETEFSADESIEANGTDVDAAAQEDATRMDDASSTTADEDTEASATLPESDSPPEIAADLTPPPSAESEPDAPAASGSRPRRRRAAESTSVSARAE